MASRTPRKTAASAGRRVAGTAADPLTPYRSKRRFDRTPEPSGGGGGGNGGLYTIQKHDARRLHYDLRLELDGVLKSWAVARGPSLDPADKRLAVRTEDHPLEYATFEGRIPEGNYGAGTVLLWDRGSWTPAGDPHEGLEQGKLVFELHGERLRGRWALVRFKGKGKATGRRENWLLIKERDDEIDRDCDVTAENATSVASGRGLDAIAAAPEEVWRGGRDQEFVIVGWSSSTRQRPFSSLLLATRDGDDLRYAGRVGSGFTARGLEAIYRKLKGLIRKTPPVAGTIPAAVKRQANWVRPELAAQIAFAEFTSDGRVRQGRFLGLREDKPAASVRREAPARRPRP